MRLCSAANEYTDSAPLVVQALQISNDFYGSDITSAHELAKRYTRLIAADKYPVMISDEIVAARDQLLAKRKLTLILRSKAVTDKHFHVCDLVQVYIKKNEKRRHWSAAKPILAYDCSSRTVTVSGAYGRQIKASLEDFRPSLPENELALAIQESIDVLDSSLDSAINELPPASTGPNLYLTYLIQIVMSTLCLRLNTMIPTRVLTLMMNNLVSLHLNLRALYQSPFRLQTILSCMNPPAPALLLPLPLIARTI